MTEMVSNEVLWNITYQDPIALHVQRRKCGWIRHILRKPKGIIKKEVDWISQEARKSELARKT